MGPHVHRIVSDPVQTARELGAEHGRTAAEAWWEDMPPHIRWFGDLGEAEAMVVPPAPDLWTKGCGYGIPEFTRELGGRSTLRDVLAYEAAFAAAVEATIREACEGSATSAR